MKKHSLIATSLFLAAALMLTGCPKPDPKLTITVQTFDATGALVNTVTDTSKPIETPLGAIVTACGVPVEFSQAKTVEPDDFAKWVASFFVGAALDHFMGWADWGLLTTGSSGGSNTSNCTARGYVLEPNETKTVMLSTSKGPTFLILNGPYKAPDPVAKLYLDYVPAFNDPTKTLLEGHVVANVDLGPYAVLSYLHIPAIGGWTGPFPGKGSQPNAEGRFSYNIVGDPVDFFATEIRTFLVPDSVTAPSGTTMTDAPIIPEALDMINTDRSGQAHPEIVVDFMPECNDTSNTVVVGHVFDVAPVPNAVVLYLYIPEAHGWSGPFPGTGAEIGTDGKFVANIVGNDHDLNATKVRISVIPDWTESPTCNICAEAPVLPYAIVSTEVDRDCSTSQAVMHGLSVVIQGQGTVIADPVQPNAGYLEGTEVTLTATPKAGSQFVSWSDNVPTTAPGQTIFTMNADKTVVATFEVIPTGEGEGEGEGCANPDPTALPTLLSVVPGITKAAPAATVMLSGVDACSMPNAKLEVYDEENFATAPYQFWGVVTKPSPTGQFWSVTGNTVAIYYNQDQADATTRIVHVRLVTADAVDEALDTNSYLNPLSSVFGKPLDLPSLTHGRVLGTAVLDLTTGKTTVVSSAFYK